MTPPLGELVHQAGILPPRRIEDALQRQRQGYLSADFCRLGELLAGYPGCSRAVIRQALARQGITVVECVLCATRYNALGFQGRGECLRCGRRLRATAPDAALSVEDTISCVAGSDGQHVLRAHRQRAPRVGRYEILGEVGRGSMGVIYKAWEPDLQRYVALKFLLADAGAGDEDQERFRREARAIAQLRHEHIVKCHTIETTGGGQSYMVMDFVAGVSLETLALRNALPREHAIQIAAQVSRALQCVHDSGLLHRDVKPANVVIDREGKAWLVDFGIAKRTQGDSFALTQEGEVLGSLAYIAPEYLVKGAAALDARCDVYGVGASLYESLTGGLLPYGDPDDDDLILRIVQEEPMPIASQCQEIDRRLAEIVDRAVSKDPAKRHATAAALAEDLEAYLNRERVGPKTRAEMDQILARSAEMPAKRARPAPPPPPPQPPQPPLTVPSAPPPSRVWPGLAGLLAAVSLLCGLGWAVTASRSRVRIETWRQRAAEESLRLGEAYAADDDADRAREAFTRTLEATPTGMHAERARAWLDRLGRGADDE